MARLTNTGQNPELLSALEGDFPYDVLDTCAADGMCAVACPVNIDTGKLTKRLRNVRHSPAAHRRADDLARNFARTERLARLALKMGHAAESLMGISAVVKVSEFVRGISGGALPAWSKDMPLPAEPVSTKTAKAGARAVYVPSCVSRVMGRLPGEPRDMSLIEAFVEVARRAGKPVWIPPDVAGTCCGTPFASKGFESANVVAVNHAIEKMWAWSEQGALPVVMDTSPCTYGLLHSREALTADNQKKFDKIRIVDGIDFTHDELLPGLSIKQRASSVALHPVCSVMKMGLTPKLQAIATACSEAVTVPQTAGCCGFAGDRGFLVPELTESATRQEAEEAMRQKHDGYFSSSRTCEIGMTRATGQIYRSYMYLLEQATR